MTTPEERDFIGEVIAEDAAMRCAVIGVKNVNCAMSTIDELRQQLADVSHERDLLRAASQWISRADSLPALHVIVALLDEETYLNTGGLDVDMHWTGAGYLCDHGDGRKYWTVFGENRAQCLDRVTHWMPLPAAPSAENQDG